MSQDPIKLRTIFMGSGEFALTILNALAASQYNLIAVYTQPDKKVGRSQELKEPEIKIAAQNINIPVYQPEKLDELAISEIKSLKPDLIIVAAYGKIIPASILTIPGFSSINVHPSLLPKFRGPSPIQNALLLGEQETGTTIMLMNESVDAGDILAQEKIELTKDETYPELAARLADKSAALLLQVIPLWIEGQIKAQPQENSDATLCQLIERSDGKINWTDTAQDIYNRFRALYSWPGVFAYWEKDGANLRIKLNKISFLHNNPETSHHLGEVFLISDQIGVQTSQGVIILEEIQLEGRKNMPVTEFVNGNPNFIGSLLK